MAAAGGVEVQDMEALVAMVGAAARGAAQGKAPRQVAAAMLAAALRTAWDLTRPCGHQTPPDVQVRTEVVGHALELHKMLDRMNGTHSHSLGTALAAARSGGGLTQEQYRSCRRLHRRGNEARHAPFEPDSEAADREEQPMAKSSQQDQVQRQRSGKTDPPQESGEG